MGGSGGGDGGGDSRNEIRYNPFIEEQYSRFILGRGRDNEFGHDGVWLALYHTYAHTSNIYNTTPYASYVPLRIENGFFGGKKVNGSIQVLENYDSIMEYIKKYMEDINPQTLWQETYSTTVDSGEVEASVAAHSALLQQELEATVYPKFLGGMFDINAVQSSAFVVGKALIEQQRVRVVNDYQAKLKIAMVELSGRLWSGKMDWYRSIPVLVKDVYVAYYADKIEYDAQQMEYKVKDRLFNLTLFDDVRAAVGALNGAAASGGSIGRSNTPSQGVRALASGVSTAAAGATIGAQIGSTSGGIYGALIGAAVGVGISFL